MTTISVVVTSYNQKNYLAGTLDSLLAQTFLPDEILVCDDASTDGSQALIEAYAKRHPGRIVPVLQEKNLGVARNRNDGLARATGNYVTTLDGDDLYAPEKLEKEMEMAQATGAALVYSNVGYMDAGGAPSGVRYKGRLRQGDLFADAATLSWPHPREVLVRRDCLDAVGLQDTGLSINEDFEWVLRLAGTFPFAGVNQVLVWHRIHNKGLSQGPRRLLLATQRQVISKLIVQVRSGKIKDRGDTLKKLEAFRDLTWAREFALAGETGKARHFLTRSLSLDPWRSAGWDLWLRLLGLPGFRRPHKIPDPLRLGPLAIPYYLVRGVM